MSSLIALKRCPLGGQCLLASWGKVFGARDAIESQSHQAASEAPSGRLLSPLFSMHTS